MVSAIIILTFMALKVGVHLAKHGEEYPREYNFFISVLTVALQLWLLYNANFFEIFNK